LKSIKLGAIWRLFKGVWQNVLLHLTLETFTVLETDAIGLWQKYKRK